MYQEISHVLARQIFILLSKFNTGKFVKISDFGDNRLQNSCVNSTQLGIVINI